MLTVSEEVQRCLPPFVILCVRKLVAAEIELDEAADEVALVFRERLGRQAGASKAEAEHFSATIDALVRLIGAMKQAAPGARLRELVRATSETRIAGLLEQVAGQMLASRAGIAG